VHRAQFQTLVIHFDFCSLIICQLKFHKVESVFRLIRYTHTHTHTHTHLLHNGYTGFLPPHTPAACLGPPRGLEKMYASPGAAGRRLHGIETEERDTWRDTSVPMRSVVLRPTRNLLGDRYVPSCTLQGVPSSWFSGRVFGLQSTFNACNCKLSISDAVLSSLVCCPSMLTPVTQAPLT
jgi:hypothetical protein